MSAREELFAVVRHESEAELSGAPSYVPVTPCPIRGRPIPLLSAGSRPQREAKGLRGKTGGVLIASTLAMLGLSPIAACESERPRPSPDPLPRRELASASSGPSAMADAADEAESAHGTELFQFATAVSQALNDRDAEPPPNNSYSHETAYSQSGTAVPYIHLEPSRTYSAISSTDCSGFVSFAVDTVSPLHHAVLQSQRHRPEYNHDYGNGFRLRESQRTWARAFVLTNFFRNPRAWRYGFQPLRSHEHLRAGDLVAYSLGRYIDPEDASLPRPADTGHTFIVAGPTTLVDPATPGYDGRGTLAAEAAEVIAVPVIDTSSIPHFDPDTRKNEKGRFVLPRRPPGVRVKAGGVGMGTVWFALDENERVIQRRLGPRGTFRNVVIGAVRLTDKLLLGPEILDAQGMLVVENFKNVPALYGDVIYARNPIDVLGSGGIRLLGGRLVLAGRSDFTGGVVVEGGWLIVASDTGLGFSDLEVRGGHVHMWRPALHEHARLRLLGELGDASVRLDFEGEDRLWSLEIDGDVYGCGSWGSPESEAMFRDPRFAGSGLLYLIGEDPSRCNGARQAAARRQSPIQRN